MRPATLDLDVYRGDVHTVRVTFQDSLGAPLVLTGVWRSQIRRHGAATDLVTVAVDATDQATGVLVLTVTGEDFSVVSNARTWVWDLEGSEWGTVLEGEVTVSPDSTRDGAVTGGPSLDVVATIGPDEVTVVSSAALGPRGAAGIGVPDATGAPAGQAPLTDGAGDYALADVTTPTEADAKYAFQSRLPVNALEYCAADATVDPNTGAVTVGTDVGTELAAAAQAAKDAGRPLYIPAGVYYSTVAIPMLPQIGVDGDGSAGQGTAARSTVVVFDLDNVTDGFTWTREGASGFGRAGYLRGMTVRAMTDRVSVRDVVGLSNMAYFYMEDVELRGGARYDIGITDCIAVRGIGVHAHRAKTAGLWVGGTNPTTTWFAHSYFQETREGPGADVDCLGASFVSCAFESNGQDVPATGIGGVRVRGGYATFDGCYWENNVGHDIWAGTESDTHLTIGAFHSLLGPISDASYAHVRLDSLVKSCDVAPGKYDVRTDSFLIHPLARGVVGAIGKGTATPVVMTDASDATSAAFGLLIATDLATGDLRTYGRVDFRFRDAHISRHLKVANGTITETAISPTGDPNTGLWFPAADRVVLNAGGINSLDVNTQQVRCVVPLRLPAYTTAQRDALAGVTDGFVILNTTVPAIQGRVAGAWVNL